MDNVALQLDTVTKCFRGVAALQDVSLTVRRGELRAIVGANGAGKSTLMKVISGQLAPTSGFVRYDGADITSMPSYLRARAGLGTVSQGGGVLDTLTIAENVMLGADGKSSCRYVDAIFRTPRQRADERRIRADARAWLDRTPLAPRANELAAGLSFGEQRMLSVVRCLCGNPTLLLLDEPAAGLRPEEKHLLAGLIQRVHDEGVTIILIEHDLEFVNNLAQYITALDLGRVIADGSPEQIWADDAVIRSYVGGGDDDY